MKHHFKVNLEVYKLFVEEDQYDKEYVDSLKNKFDYFTIRYDDEPISYNAIDLFNVIEGYSDHNQILLIGVKDDVETVLCYWFISDDSEDEERVIGIKAFKKMLKYKIK